MKLFSLKKLKEADKVEGRKRTQRSAFYFLLFLVFSKGYLFPYSKFCPTLTLTSALLPIVPCLLSILGELKEQGLP